MACDTVEKEMVRRNKVYEVTFEKSMVGDVSYLEKRSESESSVGMYLG
jgi:hypothetical protein